MSLSRTPPPPHNLPSGTTDAGGVDMVCLVCGGPMVPSENCLILNECSHVYHRHCIEGSLAASSECPSCRRSCQLSDLRKYVFLTDDLPAGFDNGASTSQAQGEHPAPRGRGRGAKAYYNTRSKSQQQELQNSLLNMTQEEGNSTPNRDPRKGNPNFRTLGNHSSNVNVDYGRINNMIERTLTRLLGNLNIIPQPRQDVVQDNLSPSIPLPPSREDLPPAVSPSGNASNDVSTTPNSLRMSYTSDKVSAIIQSWNLKFDGSPNQLNVDEFIYRVQALTFDTFNGDFSMICKNLQVLLTGKARDWYWRYRKQVPSVQWEPFCQSIRAQYRDCRTAYDIREEIRNRRQKPGETFDGFFEAVSAMQDRLPTPMLESELIEIVTRNLRPEIRQEMLYIPMSSISQLRHLVQVREHFLADEHVRRNLIGRGLNNFPPRRQVSELNVTPDFEDRIVETELSVDAVRQCAPESKCWNCDESGHHWQDCLQDRQIFCYGCGAKRVYKPNCQKCVSKKFSKNLKCPVPVEEQM